MNPEQVEALAALVTQEMDSKIRSIKSLVTPELLEKFAVGAGVKTKLLIEDARDRLLGQIDKQAKEIDELRSKLAIVQHQFERRLNELDDRLVDEENRK